MSKVLTLIKQQREGDGVVVIEERPHNDVGGGRLHNLCCARRADEAPVGANEGLVGLREGALHRPGSYLYKAAFPLSCRSTLRRSI